MASQPPWERASSEDPQTTLKNFKSSSFREFQKALRAGERAPAPAPAPAPVVEAPSVFDDAPAADGDYYYLEDVETGEFLCGSGELSLAGSVCDGAAWLRSAPLRARGRGDRSAFESTPCGSYVCAAFRPGGDRSIVAFDEGAGADFAGGARLRGLPPKSAFRGRKFRRRGPLAKPPSAHVAELKAEGFTVLPRVSFGADLEAIVRAVAARRATLDEPPTDGYIWMQQMLQTHPAFARAATHPVVLYVVSQMLGDDFHFCHTPIVNTLKPTRDLAGAAFAGQAWHADYPYRSADFNAAGGAPFAFPDEPLGVQVNLCVDEFTEQNGGTMYMPRSHLENRWPDELNDNVGSLAGDPVHARARQFVAPRGAAVVYDSRLWHRRCDERNHSGKDRVNVLHAIARGGVCKPMIDMTVEAAAFLASTIPAEITARELRDVRRLVVDAPKARRRPPVSTKE